MFLKTLISKMTSFANNAAKISGLKKRPFTVLIEGNIGSGKTTFLNHFSKFDNVCLLTEPVEQWRNLNGNNLLDLMYKDPEKFSMPFQSYVFLTMLQMHTMDTEHPIKLMERSLYSARNIFVENIYRSGIMHKAMLAVLDEWYAYIKNSVETPVDLIVYLRSSPEVVHQRIKVRARSEEQCVPLEYLRQLHELHEDWLVKKTSFLVPAPVLILNADLDLNQIGNEYRRSEGSIFQSQLQDLSFSANSIMSSPSKRAAV
ncbi:deoxynucleoside kinase [Ctenocephalides felis]|uniref:deoxynucleoside kinase n=1 Tax=Ctenocephalides felis TaxID=7515 RepID=UPI000E6E334B|nr:deoxynucleoside kinase [Ctenocephalides felis]